jgi:hypothetical protein
LQHQVKLAKRVDAGLPDGFSAPPNVSASAVASLELVDGDLTRQDTVAGRLTFWVRKCTPRRCRALAVIAILCGCGGQETTSPPPVPTVSILPTTSATAAPSTQGEPAPAPKPNDMPTGRVGNACRPDVVMCDGAQKTELVCTDGRLAARRTCHGPRGCVTVGDEGVRCDRTQALEGEDCQGEGNGACDSTMKSVLICQGGRFKTQLHCLGALGCELPGNYSIRCDKSVVEENESCAEESAVSCSTSGKQVKCKGGKFILDVSWKAKKGETCANRYRVSFETEKFMAR